MEKYTIFLALFFFTACSQPTSRYSGFKKPKELENAIIVPTDTISTKIIKASKPIDIINASDIIEDVILIPLETTSESLVTFHRKVIFHDNKIYVLDDLGSEALFIYDNNGNYLKTIGTKGQGPEEFSILHGMCIDKKNNNVILYDNGKRKMMFYDLEGNYIKNITISYRQTDQFAISPSNNIIAITSKNDGNFHLEDYDKYRLIYSDTLGNIRSLGFEFDDNINLPRSWSKIFFNGDEILFYQQYTNSIYSITDTLIREKFRIDCINFTPFDINLITSFENYEEFQKHIYTKTNLASYVAENTNHLYFVIDNKKEAYKYFYDKRTGNHIGFKKMNYNTEFFNTFKSNIFSYQDYFIGKASSEELMKLKKERDKSGKPFSNKINKIIESLKDDDNDVLVLFKIKEL